MCPSWVKNVLCVHVSRSWKQSVLCVHVCVSFMDAVTCGDLSPRHWHCHGSGWNQSLQSNWQGFCLCVHSDFLLRTDPTHVSKETVFLQHLPCAHRTLCLSAPSVPGSFEDAGFGGRRQNWARADLERASQALRPQPPPLGMLLAAPPPTPSGSVQQHLLPCRSGPQDGGAGPGGLPTGRCRGGEAQP